MNSVATCEVTKEIDKLMEFLDREIGERRQFKRWVAKHRDKLESLPFGAQLWDGRCDFNSLTHDEILLVMKAFPAGDWEKSPCGGAGITIDYNTVFDGMRVRCWNGQPPPSCRIVEEEVEIPAQPARKEIVRKMVCV